MADADLVLSVNSSHDAMTALEHAMPALRPGTLWADLNTASPGVKVALAERAAGRGVAVVDVALMSPVPGKGLRTPMLVSGEAAERYAELLAGLGAEVAVQPGPVGTAISRKLLRSVFYKGLAAAVVEALRGGEAAGCGDWLRGNIERGAGRIRRAHGRPAGRRHAPARPAASGRDGRRHRAARPGNWRIVAAARTCIEHRDRAGSPRRAARHRHHVADDNGGNAHDHRLPRPLHDRAGGAQRVARTAAGRLGCRHRRRRPTRRSATTRSARRSRRTSCSCCASAAPT